MSHAADMSPEEPSRLDEMLAEQDWMAQLAQHLAREPSRAADLLQDTWVRLLRRPPPAGAPIRGWIYRTMANQARNDHRGRVRHSQRESVYAEQRPEATRDADTLEREEILTVLRDGLAKLDAPYRDVVYLRYFAEREPSEIAQLLDVPAPTVRTRLKRARDRLRDVLDERFSDRKLWAAPLLGWATARLQARRSVSGTPVGPGLVGRRLAWSVLTATVVSAPVVLWANLTEPERDVDRRPEPFTELAPEPSPGPSPIETVVGLPAPGPLLVERGRVSPPVEAEPPQPSAVIWVVDTLGREIDLPITVEADTKRLMTDSPSGMPLADSRIRRELLEARGENPVRIPLEELDPVERGAGRARLLVKAGDLPAHPLEVDVTQPDTYRVALSIPRDVRLRLDFLEPPDRRFVVRIERLDDMNVNPHRFGVEPDDEGWSADGTRWTHVLEGEPLEAVWRVTVSSLFPERRLLSADLDLHGFEEVVLDVNLPAAAPPERGVPEKKAADPRSGPPGQTRTLGGTLILPHELVPKGKAQFPPFLLLEPREADERFRSLDHHAFVDENPEFVGGRFHYRWWTGLLPEGSYTLKVRQIGAIVGQVEVPAPDAAITLALPDLRRLEVRVTEPGGSTPRLPLLIYDADPATANRSDARIVRQHHGRFLIDALTGPLWVVAHDASSEVTMFGSVHWPEVSEGPQVLDLRMRPIPGFKVKLVDNGGTLVAFDPRLHRLTVENADGHVVDHRERKRAGSFDVIEEGLYALRVDTHDGRQFTGKVVLTTGRRSEVLLDVVP